VKWRGPRSVESAESDSVYPVENLLAENLKAEHARRLEFYRGKELNVNTGLDQAVEKNDHEL
jgi:hypothetical protein